MPSPSVQVSVYPTGAQVMQRARTFINDAFQGGAGRILTNQATFSIEYLNQAQADLQDLLANNGVSTFYADNYLILNLPAIPVSDPSIQAYIDYTGYFDGQTLHTGGLTNQGIPMFALPPDLIVPLVLEERQSGTNNRFTRMTSPMESLPNYLQNASLNHWEWRGDKIYLLGANQNRDLRMRYERMLPPIQANADLTKVTIPIVDSLQAMAWRVAYLFASARSVDGGARAGVLDMEYQKAAQKLIVRYTRRDQRIQYRRGQFGRHSGWGPVGIYKS